MICNHCGCEIGENYFTVCPFCGIDLIPEVEPEQVIIDNSDIIETTTSDMPIQSNNELAMNSYEETELSAPPEAQNISELFLKSVAVTQLNIISKTEKLLLSLGINTAYDFINTEMHKSECSASVYEDMRKAKEEIREQLDLLNLFQIENSSEFGKYHPIELTEKSQSYLESKNIPTIRELCIFILEHDFIDILKEFECDEFKKVLTNIGKHCDYFVAEYLLKTLKQKIGFNGISDNTKVIPVNTFYILGVQRKVSTFFEKNGYTTILDLQNLTSEHLVDLFYCGTNDSLRLLYERLHEIKNNSIGILFNQSISTLSPSWKDVIARRAIGETLDAIGNSIDLTRERIRQIEVKAADKLKWLRDYIATKCLENRSYFQVSDIEEMIGENKDTPILRYSFVIDEDYEYLPYAKTFIVADPFDKKKMDNFITSIVTEEIGDEIINIFDACEKLGEIFQANGIDFMGVDELVDFFYQNNFKIKGEYVSKNSITKEKAIEVIIPTRFPNGIKICQTEDYTEDLEQLKNILLDEFGIAIENNQNRSLSSIIARAGTILAGKGLYISKQNIKIDLPLLDKIVEYVKERIEISMGYSRIFDEFQGPLLTYTSIDNYEYLHGVLKEFYPDDFEYRKSCVVRLGSEANEKGLSMKERVYSILREEHVPISIKQIQEKLGSYSLLSLNQMMNLAPDICHCGSQMYVLSSYFDLSEEDEKNLISWTDILLEENNGYCSMEVLREYISSNYHEFINHHPLDNQFYMSNYLTNCKCETDFEFNRPHIVKKGLIQGEINAKSIVEFVFRGILLNSKEVLNFAEKFKIAHMSLETAFREHINEKYIQIEKNKFLLGAQFVITDQNLIEIDSYIESHFKNDCFTLFLNYDYSGLPYIGYEWNNYLLHSIIVLYFGEKYKELKTKEYKRNNTSCLIVRADNPCNDYETFVIKFMVLETGKKQFDMYEFLIYLQLRGWAGNELSKSVLESDLIEFDEKNCLIFVNH